MANGSAVVTWSSRLFHELFVATAAYECLRLAAGVALGGHFAGIGRVGRYCASIASRSISKGFRAQLQDATLGHGEEAGKLLRGATLEEIAGDHKAMPLEEEVHRITEIGAHLAGLELLGGSDTVRSHSTSTSVRSSSASPRR